MSNEGISPLPETAAASRAVVVCEALTRDGAVQHLHSVRNDSSFVAQLIATADNLPQTRQRRRAEPRDALAAYTLPRDFVPTCASTRRLA